MRILAIDMGTGTQDILLYDSTKPVENSVKMVLPSATEIAARRIRRATAAGRAVVLGGVVAGGGPCSWALEDHLRAGGTAFATPEAAQTFNDDLDEVRAMGVELVSEDEAARIDGERVVLQDLDLEAIRVALMAFEEPGDVDGIALGCLDHGAAPRGVSDRLFRFEHLRRIVESRNDLLAFASRGEELPAYLTRARSMVASAHGAAPVAFMDTGPAAALGALHDEHVGAHDEHLVLNLGNMHLLGFHLRGRQVASLFEHHTGEVTSEQIVRFATRLAEGTLEHAEIFESKGHGAYHAGRELVRPAVPGVVAVTGPQRGKVRGTALRPYFAAPFGDMMISGCFGLLRGYAEVFPEARDAVEAQLGRG
ncbi:MAG: pyruvate formate lyase-activating protein [Dehalococcoidia bacterium]|nr:pyruvate formate lyase-activating protein [Dehalococcoidia bacterium]